MLKMTSGVGQYSGYLFFMAPGSVHIGDKPEPNTPSVVKNDTHTLIVQSQREADLAIGSKQYVGLLRLGASAHHGAYNATA